MDWDAFLHGFGMLITLVMAVLPLMALLVRNDDDQAED